MGLVRPERQKNPPKVSVVPLTSDLCGRLKAEAALALNGDGTCSLRAMSMSCFASEMCAKNRFSNMTLDMLMQSTYKFVALDGPDGVFIGCVSAYRKENDTTAVHYFPHHPIVDGALLLYNLCVADEFRGRGAGRLLVEAVLHAARRPSLVYLLVSKLNLHEPDPEKLAAYKARIARLLGTYEKLDFAVECECDACYMLRHR